MKKKMLVIVIAALLLSIILKADSKLNEIDRLIDDIERSFWSTVSLGDDELARADMTHKMLELKTLSREIQQDVVGRGWGKEFNFPKYPMIIGSAWSDLRRNETATESLDNLCQTS